MDHQDGQWGLLSQWIAQSQRIVFFGGAGVSTESGIPDFRGAKGFYHQEREIPLEQVLSIDFFTVHPQAYWEWFAQENAREGVARLLAELAEKDPRAHRAIHHGNVRRVIRALEVVRLTGGPYTPRFPRHTSFYPNVSVFATTRRTDLLDQAIRARAERMVDDGLIEETRALLDRGLAQGPTAPRATGYSQAIAVIEGRLDRREAAQAIAQATRRLAKKQTTWFTADPRVRWIDLSDGDVCGAATRILDTVGP